MFQWFTSSCVRHRGPVPCHLFENFPGKIKIKIKITITHWLNGGTWYDVLLLLSFWNQEFQHLGDMVLRAAEQPYMLPFEKNPADSAGALSTMKSVCCGQAITMMVSTTWMDHTYLAPFLTLLAHPFKKCSTHKEVREMKKRRRNNKKQK